MPFKSEKQRRYLWANEPEIARDWTDTYGSRIKKNSGGISQLVKSGPGRPGYRGDAGYRSGSEQASSIGQGNVGSQASFGGGQGQDSSGKSEGAAGADSSYVKPAQKASHERVVAEARIKEEKKAKKIKVKREKDEKKYRAKVYSKRQLIDKRVRHGFKYANPGFNLTKAIKELEAEMPGASYEEMVNEIISNPTAHGAKPFEKYSPTSEVGIKQLEKYPNQIREFFTPTENPGGLLTGALTGGANMLGNLLQNKTPYEREMRRLTGQYGSLTGKGEFGLENIGGGGDIPTRSDFDKKFNPNTWAQQNDSTWNPISGKFEPIRGDGQGGGYMGYPSYAAWQAAQGGGGGGGTTTATTAASTPSAFQQSLTTGASSPFDYYVGQDPTAKNLAWGEKFGVDPRTMYKTSWADGGRIGRAYGGIMDSSTGRRAYGFGSIFSKIGKAAKKVLKSPIGKAALIGGLGAWGMGAGPFANVAGQGWLKGAMAKGMVAPSPKKAGWLRNLFTGGKGYAADQWNPWKIGIGALGALPFFMGGDEDKEEGFDYEGAKNKYWDEIMRIKSGAMAGSLDPTKFNYLGAKDGGRIGLYAGGQSTPSDYTMEDAMMTTTQDKLGGITDVMKQADLSRQGSVGQFYAAHGGSADDNNARLEARVKELQDEGLSWDAAWAQAHNELRDKNAQGGRIGYDDGGPSEIGGDNISEVLKRVQELEDEGLDFGAAMAQAMKELSQGKAHGGRIGADEGGLMDLGGMEKDYRNDGGFVPLGGEEKADDVPARLSKNEFVFTADAVRGAGDGDIDKGAEIMENIMKNLEQGGKISAETQGNTGAQEMFSVSERLGEVI